MSKALRKQAKTTDFIPAFGRVSDDGRSQASYEYFALQDGASLCVARVYRIDGQWRVLALELRREVVIGKAKAPISLVKQLFDSIEKTTWNASPETWLTWSDAVAASAKGWLKANAQGVEFIGSCCRPLYGQQADAGELARQVCAAVGDRDAPRAYALI